MRVSLLLVGLVGLHSAALASVGCAVAGDARVRDVRIEAFQSYRRGDNYGIASFTLVNDGEKPISSIELGCWTGADRGRQSKVVAWPAKGFVPAHGSAQFSNVNIGLVALGTSPQCEVTAVEN